jgi:SpoVK/Ycf46/Vps4 family AAA+-type ATPase
MGHIVILPIIIYLIAILARPVMQWLEKGRWEWHEYFVNRRLNKIFGHNYIDTREFYFQTYRQAPCKSYIGDVDVAKLFTYINEGFAGKVIKIYQRNIFNWQAQKLEFTVTVFKLADKVMIEMGDDYADILFAADNYEKANELMQIFSAYKAPEREKEFEINIITFSNGSLDLKQLEIKPTQLDIALYYNDDFAETDALIKQRLGNNNDKGIVLLHGLPGTGKTTYLRHLIGSIQKKILFVSPSVACNLVNPEFIDILIDNPNSVLIIEDAENIIMDRRYNSDSSVSNLLNLSDGLMSDFLNVQIVCTFNSDLNRVDSALLRKGRLIACYEFGKLDAVKAQRLSNHFGFTETITKPMTIAEIANPSEKEQRVEKVQVLGFRRETLMN